MKKNNFFPNIKQSFFLFVLHFIIISSVSFIFSLFYGFVLAFQGIKNAQLISRLITNFINSNVIYFSMIGIVLSTIVLLIITLRKRSLKYKKFLFENIKKVNFKIVFFIFLAAVSLSILVSMLSEIIFTNNVGNEVLENAFKMNIYGILFALVIAPLFEEIIFRGIILKGLIKNNSILTALIISSVLFSISHFTLVQLLPTFIAGLFFGYVFYKSKSLIITMFTHFSYNLLPIIIIHNDSLVNTFKNNFSNYLIFISVILIFILFYCIKKISFYYKK